MKYGMIFKLNGVYVNKETPRILFMPLSWAREGLGCQGYQASQQDQL